jgi:hypothetical protein
VTDDDDDDDDDDLDGRLNSKKEAGSITGQKVGWAVYSFRRTQNFCHPTPGLWRNHHTD